MKTRLVSLLLAWVLALIALPTYAGPSGLVNTSGLVTVHGRESFVLGFVVAGDEDSSHLLLIRAVGKALQSLGVSDYLPDPVLTLYSVKDGQSSIVSIFPFQTADAQFYSSAVGAFPIDKGQEQEGNVVILTTLPPGVYTASIGSKGGSTGRVLAEIYAVDDAGIIRLPSPTVTGTSSIALGQEAEFTVTRPDNSLGESFAIDFDDDGTIEMFTQSSSSTTSPLAAWRLAG